MYKYQLFFRKECRLMMNGTIIDCSFIAVGGLIGAFAKSKIITGMLQDKLMQALAMCAFLTGIVGVMDLNNPIICILSIIVGACLGNILSLEDHLVWVLNRFSTLLAKAPISEHFIKGFISYSLLSIAGSMAIIGPITNCLTGDISILITKAVLDFICAILFAATFGLSVVCTVVVVFTYQGIFALLALIITPAMTTAVIGDMSAIGSLLIFLMGFNLLKVTDIKTMNLTPAIFIPIILYQFIG